MQGKNPMDIAKEVADHVLEVAYPHLDKFRRRVRNAKYVGLDEPLAALYAIRKIITELDKVTTAIRQIYGVDVYSVIEPIFVDQEKGSFMVGYSWVIGGMKRVVAIITLNIYAPELSFVSVGVRGLDGSVYRYAIAPFTGEEHEQVLSPEQVRRFAEGGFGGGGGEGKGEDRKRRRRGKRT
ncbi:MAG: hypothetical protein ACK4SY_07115 [Pyrobaculum sp.]